MTNESQDMLKMSLSILLSASVAHVLYLIAITIDENHTVIWFIFTLGIVILTIGLILYIVDINFKFEKDEKIDPTNFFKTLLIIIFTIDIFSIVRFFHFYKTEVTTYIELSYQLIWYIALGACAVLSGLAIFEFKNDKSKVKWIVIVVIVIFLTLLFLGFIGTSNDVLKLMGVLK